MNAQLAVVMNQLAAIQGISKSRMASFQITRQSLETRLTPGGIPGPGLAEAPMIKLLEAEINAEDRIQRIIGEMPHPTPMGVPPKDGSGLLLAYADWDVNDNTRASLGLNTTDPEPIPEEVVKYAAAVVLSTFGITFSFAALPKGSTPGSTSMNPNAPPGGNSPFGVI